MQLLLLTLSLVASTTAVSLFDKNLENEWESFKKTYGRNYKDNSEESYRYFGINSFKYSF